MEFRMECRMEVLMCMHIGTFETNSTAYIRVCRKRRIKAVWSAVWSSVWNAACLFSNSYLVCHVFK